MNKQLSITFHNPNDKEETTAFLISMVTDILVERAIDEPKAFFELLSSLEGGGEIESSSLL